MIIRPLNRVKGVAAVSDGGSDAAVITEGVDPGGRPPGTSRARGACPPPRTPLGEEPAQLELAISLLRDADSAPPLIVPLDNVEDNC